MRTRVAMLGVFTLGGCAGVESDGVGTVEQPQALGAAQAAVSTPTLTPPITTAVAVGTLPGDLQVTADGAATYSIPIEVPPGRAGMQPSLTLSYSSRGGEGIAGVGWSLSGSASQISRCGSDTGRDGEVRPVQLDAHDHFCLDGARLVDVSWGTGTEYRTEPDSASRIFFTASSNTWSVRARDGRIYYYGEVKNSRLDATRSAVAADHSQTAPSVVTVGWLLDYVQDRSGNYMTYTYLRTPDPDVTATNGNLEWELARIDYTGSNTKGAAPTKSVTFAYEPRDRPTLSFLHGVALRSSRRLKTITTALKRTPSDIVVRTYSLDYPVSSDADYFTKTLSHRTHLKSVQTCAGAGGCLPATTFTYADSGPPGFTGTPLGINDALLAAADFDGDGRTDLLTGTFDIPTLRLSNGTGFGQTAISGLGSMDTTTDPRPGHGRLRPLKQHVVYDVFGHDKANIAAHYYVDQACPNIPDERCPTAANVVWEWNGSRFGRISTDEDLPPNYFAGPFGSYIDFNGDLTPDLVYNNSNDLNPGISRWTVRWLSGSGTLQDHPAYTALGRPNQYAKFARFLDWDGDGATDVLLPYVPVLGNTFMFYDVLHSRKVQGQWTLEVEPTNLFVTVDLDSSNKVVNNKELNCTVFADVNGDGLPDMVGLLGGVQLKLNKGNGAFLSVSTPLEPGSSFSGLPAACTNSTDDGGARVVDYNQDGRQDILLTGTTGDGVPYARVLESTGTQFTVRTTTLPLVGTAGAKIVDVNGDGLFDLVRFENGSWILYSQGANHVDVLTSVTNGLGSKHGVVYRPLTETGYTRPGNSQGDRGYLSANLVVTTESASSPESRGDAPAGGAMQTIAEHTYAGGRVDTAGEGFLGFQTHTVVDQREPDPLYQARTIYTFNQAPLTVAGKRRHPFAGRVSEEVHYVAVRGTTTHYVGTRTTTDYATQEYTGPDGIPLYFPYARTITTRDYDQAAPLTDPGAVAMSTATTTMVADNFGNTTSVVVNRGVDPVSGGAMTTTTTRTFRNDTVNWLISFPTDEKVESIEGGQKQTRQVSTVYESNTDRVLNTIHQRDVALQTGESPAARCTHVASRDAFGNVLKVEETQGNGCSSTGARVTTFVYGDSDGIFWTSTSNALNQTQARNVDPGLGVTYQTTDINGLVVNSQFDGFGRLLKVARPDGTSSTITHSSCTDPPDAPAGSGIRYAFCVTTVGSDGSNTIAMADVQGRTVRTLTAHGKTPENKKKYIRQDNSYDRFGRPMVVTRPYVGGDMPGIVNSTTYDAAGRPISVCHGDTIHCQHIQYSGLSTYLYDEAFRPSKATARHSFGPVASTTIYPNGVPALTSFSYGPFDSLIKVTDAKNNIVTQDFDNVGRKKAMSDADTGPISWTYDAFDQVLTEKRANGVTTTMTYDALGRLTSRTPSDLSYTDNYIYDAAPNANGETQLPGNGLLKQQKHTDTYGSSTVIEDFTYDLSRPSSHSWNIDGTSYQIRSTYDPQGRPSLTTYPSAMDRSFGTLNLYDDDGLLYDIREASNLAHSLWTRLSDDAELRVTSERLGNGTTNTYAYSPAFGRMTLSLANGAAGSPIVNETYLYDQFNNLLSRTDNLQNRLTETFDYDPANQLTRATLTGQPPQTFTYDSIGNLLTNSALPSCDFRYGETGHSWPDVNHPVGPHALTRMYCASNNYSYSMAYDFNGQQVVNWWAGGESIDWNAFGKPKRIQSPILGGGMNDERFAYDAGHNKVRKVVVAGAKPSITYVGGLFEVRTVATSQQIDYVYHFKGGQLIYRYNPATRTGTNDYRYFHKDRQGSVIATTDASGVVKERMSYDTFGARRRLNWTPSTSVLWTQDISIPIDTRISYTGQEYDDENFLIDMGARLYSPWMNRFMSPDSIVQDPTNGLSWNRYTYVFNNPLRYTDPTGHLAQEVTAYNFDANPSFSTTLYGANNWNFDPSAWSGETHTNWGRRVKPIAAALANSSGGFVVLDATGRVTVVLGPRHTDWRCNSRTCVSYNVAGGHSEDYQDEDGHRVRVRQTLSRSGSRDQARTISNPGRHLLGDIPGTSPEIGVHVVQVTTVSALLATVSFVRDLSDGELYIGSGITAPTLSYQIEYGIVIPAGGAQARDVITGWSLGFSLAVPPRGAASFTIATNTSGVMVITGGTRSSSGFSLNPFPVSLSLTGTLPWDKWVEKVNWAFEHAE